MNTMKNNEQGTKPEIKINRKMRMWNKYKNYCIIGGGIVAVVLLLVLVVNIFPGSKENVKPQNDISKDIAKESVTDNDGQSQEATQEESQSETAGETPTETNTEAPTQAQPSPSAPEKQTFTAKDKFSKSVFVGDTIVNGISYYKYLNASQVVSSTNMVSEQVAGRADEIAKSSPEKVFIMIGLNDANYGTRTTDQVLNNIKKSVEAIKAKNGSAKIYVLSVMPITKEFENSSNVKQSFINELNYKLSTNASSFGASYIDVATAFKDSTGYLYSECTGSGYSLKTEYYPYLLNRIAGAL